MKLGLVDEHIPISAITAQVMRVHPINFHAPQYFEKQETIYRPEGYVIKRPEHAEILNVLSNSMPEHIVIYRHVTSLLLEIDLDFVAAALCKLDVSEGVGGLKYKRPLPRRLPADIQF